MKEKTEREKRWEAMTNEEREMASLSFEEREYAGRAILTENKKDEK